MYLKNKSILNIDNHRHLIISAMETMESRYIDEFHSINTHWETVCVRTRQKAGGGWRSKKSTVSLSTQPCGERRWAQILYPNYLYHFIFFWLCSEGCGILVPSPGLNPYPLYGSTESEPLDCQGSPSIINFKLHSLDAILLSIYCDGKSLFCLDYVIEISWYFYKVHINLYRDEEIKAQKVWVTYSSISS